MPDISMVEYGIVGAVITAMGRFAWYLYNDQKEQIKYNREQTAGQIKYNQEQSEKREEKLMNYLDKKNEQDVRMVSTMEDIKNEICNVSCRIEKLEECHCSHKNKGGEM
jgi:hypothetical protein